jgi:hypothetical protein
MKLQSAMEYLATYGWSFIIVIVVLVALFSLGLFNSATYAPKAAPGACSIYRPQGPGTVTQLSLSGACSSIIPRFTSSFGGAASMANGNYLSTTPLYNAPSWTFSAWVDPQA